MCYEVGVFFTTILLVNGTYLLKKVPEGEKEAEGGSCMVNITHWREGRNLPHVLARKKKKPWKMLCLWGRGKRTLTVGLVIPYFFPILDCSCSVEYMIYIYRERTTHDRQVYESDPRITLWIPLFLCCDSLPYACLSLWSARRPSADSGWYLGIYKQTFFLNKFHGFQHFVMVKIIITRQVHSSY